MTLHRRGFLALACCSTLVYRPARLWAQSSLRTGVKAVVFDALTLLDPRPVATLAEALFPGKGVALTAAWRSRQFEYQWLRALGGRYADFVQATQDSLVFAASQLRLELPADTRLRLMSAWSQLGVWPDVPDAIRQLKQSGVRLAVLSNMTGAMLRNGLGTAALDTQFETILSTDSIRSYKPDPAAYAMALRRLHLQRENVLFVAFAAWDVAGAKWFGYPTFWMNRLTSPDEELGAAADAAGADFESLLPFILQHPARTS